MPQGSFSVLQQFVSDPNGTFMQQASVVQVIGWKDVAALRIGCMAAQHMRAIKILIFTVAFRG